MSETFSKVEVITGVARRQRFTTEQKLLVVNEALHPDISISYVARHHGLSPSRVLFPPFVSNLFAICCMSHSETN
jgi:transposase